MNARSILSITSLAHRLVSRAILQTSTAALILIGVVLASVPASAASHASSTNDLVALLAPQLDGQININTASGAELQLLPGIGPATAAKILEYRTHRPFAHPTHLMRIKGIGSKTFSTIRPYVVVEGETTLRAAAGP